MTVRGCPRTPLTAVVAADAGGLPDLIEHGETGLLYDPEKPEALDQAIGRLLAQPALATSLARRGRAFAEASTWDAQTEQLIECYARTLRLRRQRSAVGQLLGGLRTATAR